MHFAGSNFAGALAKFPANAPAAFQIRASSRFPFCSCYNARWFGRLSFAAIAGRGEDAAT